ncbi:conjugative relaxase-like TrwC/TraI family protein [Bradyrhizobium japonicum]|uniref:Conjugative relaxase-like TrwC/TraI family protein n=1 Tax=Bradyrhizobium japonicum TaxID=375 RepID=A0ABV2RGA1_BRAJP
MTASLHALGCGRSAGAYYTEDPNREASPRFRDNYYARDNVSGTWWSTSSSVVRNGSSIEKETFRDLCAGIDPRTGKSLVRGAGERHRAGWDITFSTPKSFGILWAAGSPEQRAILEAIQGDAVDQALQMVADERLIEVRLGAGGRLREAPSDIMVAKFPHFTSREGDPACHTHCVLLNSARSSSDPKKYLTIEPRQVYAWQVVLGAAFRTTLSEKLVAMGFSVRAAGRDQFEIAGISDALIEQFSKRSRQIKAVVRGDASAAEKEVAALATRGDKASVPTGDELERRWRQELAAFGIDPWSAALAAGRKLGPHRGALRDYEFDPPEVPGDTPVALAASEIFRTESVATRKELLQRALAEASLQGGGIESVYAGLAEHAASGKLVRLDRDALPQHWTTAGLAAEEATLLRLAGERQRGSWFKPAAIEAALKHASILSEEQHDAIREVTSKDPTCVLEAGAGTGKTTLAKVVVDAAKRSGLTTVGLAPSWVAADELSRSTGIEAIAIARFRHEIDAGKRRPPDSKTLVIVDEAGMVGMRDMAAIFKACAGHVPSNALGDGSAKILLCGDRRQLASVAGGSALRAIADTIERSSTLRGVRRQAVDWQRAASVAMAQGDSEAGLRAYAEEDRIEMVAGREAAEALAIKTWQDLRRLHGDDVIVVTRRNRDAVSLNLAAREILREERKIQGPDIVLPAIDRDGEIVQLPLAMGDRIRFSETLPRHEVRNGTRGTVEQFFPSGDGSVRLAIRLEDGRVVEDAWSGFAVRRRSHQAGVPKIVHSVAGSAYSVQGRTAAATVYYVPGATDARETYVALTRHRNDVRIVVESGRLAGICRTHQADPSVPPTKSVLLERLFSEARRYREKVNVADYVEDRLRFVKSGSVELPQVQNEMNLGLVARAARRIELAAQSLGLDGCRFIAELRRRALRLIPERQLYEGAASIVEKVKSWSRTRVMSVERDPHEPSIS